MMLMLKRRLQEHAATTHVRYTQAIINHGREAGASLAHPHGQLLGLPFVPGEILEEQRAFTRFEGGCILCATIEAELVDGKRVLFANDDVVCVSPFWAGTPYELLIIPRSHDLHLTDSTDDDAARRWASPSATALVALREIHGDVAYNLVFHTAPHHYNGSYHWHVHLFPKLVTTAGFERGTGVMINIVPPETRRRAAAQRRRRSLTHAPMAGIRVGIEIDATPGAGVGGRRAGRTSRRLDARRRRHPLHRRADPRRRHRVPVRHQGRPDQAGRPDGDHRVGARRGDGRAPHRPGHRQRPLHARAASTVTASSPPHPVHLGGDAASSPGGWAARSARWSAASWCCGRSGGATCAASSASSSSPHA